MGMHLIVQRNFYLQRKVCHQVAKPRRAQKAKDKTIVKIILSLIILSSLCNFALVSGIENLNGHIL